MKNKLPEKLPKSNLVKDIVTRIIIKDLSKKINEIIDYLEDREEASQYKIVSFNKVGETVPADRDGGECACACHDPKYLSYHGQGVVPCCSNPDKKLDPPEHEEKTRMILRAILSDLVMGRKGAEQVMDYIQDNFVSKEKINRAVDDADAAYDPWEKLKIIKESLGLDY